MVTELPSFDAVTLSGELQVPLPDPYEVVSVRSVPAPSGASGADWFRYEIKQGGNTITGYRAGGVDMVRCAVDAIVLQLNERRKHRRGRVNVVLEPRAGAKSAAVPDARGGSGRSGHLHRSRGR